MDKIVPNRIKHHRRSGKQKSGGFKTKFINNRFNSKLGENHA